MADIQVGIHALVTRPDLRAAAWIQDNVPEEARFLVNSFFAYGGSSIVGSDAGWWLPLIARRQTTLPPLNYVAERGPRPDYVTWVNELPEQLSRLNVYEIEGVEFLKARDVTHIYIGQRQGRVNYRGPLLLDPARLLESPHYEAIYHRDRVWIFAIKT